jgi:CheY-like chemotaxis protein
MSETKRILFVEDNLNDIELTLTALSEHGLANEVVVVHDGAAALDYLYRRGDYAQRPAGLPVVVLLDVKLPKVDGIEVLRQMRSDEVLRMVPVVMLSSSNEQTDLLRSYALGTSAYVVKPMDFFDFVVTVKQLGLFWGLINEPPPGIQRIPRPERLFKNVNTPPPVCPPAR